MSAKPQKQKKAFCRKQCAVLKPVDGASGATLCYPMCVPALGCWGREQKKLRSCFLPCDILFPPVKWDLWESSGCWGVFWWRFCSPKPGKRHHGGVSEKARGSGLVACPPAFQSFSFQSQTMKAEPM